MKKVDFAKVKNNLSRFARNLAGHAFLTFLTSIFIGLIIGGFLFYQYSFLPEKAGPEIMERPIQFKENTYQKILVEWQDREKSFAEAEFKNYIDAFRLGSREEAAEGKKKLSEERTQELLANPLIQELLKTSNLYEFYSAKGEKLLIIEERAQIWEELELGSQDDYQGTYSQNIQFLSELKKELTK